MLIILVPGLRAEDVTAAESVTLRHWTQTGAGGWMVCRAARSENAVEGSDGRDSAASLLLTLGSGSRAVALPLSVSGAQVLSETWRDLQAANSTLDHPVTPGLLGDLIHAQGKQTAVLGNRDAAIADTSALYLAMNGQGKVDVAEMGEAMNLADATAPYGLRANAPRLLHTLETLNPQIRLVVLVFADVERADRYAPLCLPAVAKSHRMEALRRLDSLLAALPADSQTARLLLAPAPAVSTDRLDRLAPVLLSAPGIAPGPLTSPSTRRVGLLVNTDLLPTLVALLGLPTPRNIVGRAATTVSDGDWSAAKMRALHDRFLRTGRLQNTPGGLPTVQMILALLLLACLIVYFAPTSSLRGKEPGVKHFVAAVAVAMAALPLGMLVLPQAHPSDVRTACVLLTVWTLLFILVTARRPQKATDLFAGLCGALLLLVLLDLLTGSHLMRDAWMSYSAVEGARFYGIGNEYMGATIGAACALAGLRRWEGKRFWLLALGFAALLVAMGWFGTKVGAFPSAGAAFGVALLVRWRGKLRARDLLAALVACLLLLSGFALLDFRRGAGGQSHLARALAGSGGDTLFGIVRRKLLLEGHLLLHSAWSLTLLVCAGGLSWLYRTQPQIFQPLPRRAALYGLVAGTVASLICNDSGVTAGALILIYGWAWAMLQAVRQEPEPKP